MPHLYIVSGCNGAGKTTGSFTILPEILLCKEFINADMIAYGIAPFRQEEVAFQAGRIMLQKIKRLLEEGADFAFETTLSTRSYAPFIKEAKQRGYTVTLLFFWLESPDMARRRVAKRVVLGGHNIPEDDIERRYYRGIKNLYDLYVPIVDNWIVVNNTITPTIVATNRDGVKEILNESIIHTMKEQIREVREPEASYGVQQEDDLFEKIIKGLRKGYRKLVLETAARNGSLVVLLDGKVQDVPAKDLLHTIPDEE